MTFKDLVRLLRRRWLTAFSVFAVVFASFMAYSRYNERPAYRARTRVLITTPPILVTASQGTQWISVNQMEPRTWHSIITSRQIREASEKALRASVERDKLGYAVNPAWFHSVTVVPEQGSQLTWIEATAPTAAIAADVANAVALEVDAYSREIATKDLRDARASGEEQRAREEAAAAAAEAAARKIRDDARSRLGSDNLELEVRKLSEEINAHDTRRRDIERRLNANRLRLERVRADRSVADHLQREGVPRLAGSASVESRLLESALVARLSDRLETLHRDLLAALRKYTEEHPLVKGLRGDIRQGELDLTRAKMQALGQDIDREEVTLRTDSELGGIELKVLQPEAGILRERLNLLSPLLDDVKNRERLAHDARARMTTQDTLIANLSAAPKTGYVQMLKDGAALPDDALRVEARLGKSWPVALMASLILGLSFAFLVEFVDTTLRTDYDVRRHLDYPVLAVVPKVAKSELGAAQAPRTGILSEIFDTLATVLFSAPSEHPSRVFLITSTNPREGKTAASVNLATALARQGRRTLLVDADLRVPSVHTAMMLPNAAGLSELLAGAAQLDSEGILQTLEIPNLTVITSGVSVDNPYELLDPARVGPIVAQMRQQFDAVVIDTPPVLRTGDALKMAGSADAVLFVIESGKTDTRQATWAKRLLQNVGARVSGVILNRAISDTEEYYYYYGAAGRRKEARSA